jgi:hypothetical protein
LAPAEAHLAPLASQPEAVITTSLTCFVPDSSPFVVVDLHSIFSAISGVASTVLPDLAAKVAFLNPFSSSYSPPVSTLLSAVHSALV